MLYEGRLTLTTVCTGRSTSSALDEYLSTFSENLERFRLQIIVGEFDDDSTMKNRTEILRISRYIEPFFVINSYSEYLQVYCKLSEANLLILLFLID